MVDANHAYNAHTAIKVGKELEKYNVYWFEEPIIPEDIDSYLEVKRGINIAIAGGECEFTQYGFKDMLKKRSVDIAQPDVCVTGGFTACQKIVFLANIFGVHVIPHIWGSAVSIFATLQLLANIPDLPKTNISRPGVNQTLFEFDQSENPLREGFVKNKIELKDGIITIPDSPGIGVDIDEKSLSKFIIK
jgi:D-galactarolactone cycloisomerase